MGKLLSLPSVAEPKGTAEPWLTRGRIANSLSPNPYGVAALEASRMKSLQDYDISVTFTMPRSPANLDRGNFMVSLHLIESRDMMDTRAKMYAEDRAGFSAERMLFSSRRSALMPYVDPMVSLTSRVLFMAYHLLSPNSQRHTMTVRLAERVSFERESKKPAAAYIEVEAGQDIQIYSTQLTLTAQLRGLRWLMVQYRLLTYIVFTLLFWFCEVLFMSAAWSIWSSYTAMPANEGKLRIRASGEAGGDESGADLDHDDGDEDDDDGDETEPSSRPKGRSFPIKHEHSVKGEGTPERSLADIPAVGADADDEDDFDEEERKHLAASGRGTSYSKEGAESVRRRALHGIA